MGLAEVTLRNFMLPVPVKCFKEADNQSDGQETICLP
jgi:hypothetical protein